ncbi:DNA polymerase III subunit gamma/tau [Marinimicrobium agarilyticum]|uniref:DNA polymerase III subunit gamma/tau n=1 Tax=Marinimicrobium agarilyticum TaxID=306546 RepID=UPI0004043CE8|nr:DNA polymerase III subunit gamma/tau [Marinimicrobium agarilyticum]
MSYQVLARKYRPRTFRETVGQEHVLQALINALDHNRLHHAYLFTGTRGVGKTTIARILAKCLNCESGVSSEPCGQCSACVEIAENRFVDLIEVDAASRTKVEDTRELLENVQYAPTRGRYKVYLIDEVHMLSGHSFNALLKTLEEPPPHVKFLLATTDPQKLPVTILSRCLQFNLKNMNPEWIVHHLKEILEKELVPFEESALWLLGRSADGSMRDAMSLSDQAIAYGSGKITEAEVRTMLGTIDQRAIYEMIGALARQDGKALLGAVEQMSEQAPDYAAALAELLALMHRVAIAQALPEAVDNSHGDRDKVLELAQALPPEDIQLFYQTALLGRRDLPLAPDPRAGLEMVLLRMLAFKPQGLAEIPKKPLPAAGENTPPTSPGERLAEQIPEETPAAKTEAAPDFTAREEPATDPKPLADKPPEPVAPRSAESPVTQDAPVAQEPPMPQQEEPPPYTEEDMPPFDGPYQPAPKKVRERSEHAPEPRGAIDAPPRTPEPQPRSEPPAPPPASSAAPTKPVETGAPPPRKKTVPKVALADTRPENWAQVFLGLNAGGLLQSTAANCVLVGRQGNDLSFVLDERHSALFDEGQQQRLADVLTDYYGEPVRVRIQPGEVEGETPAAQAQRIKEENRVQALEAMKTDPIVQQLVEHFGATLREDTVQPLE